MIALFGDTSFFVAFLNPKDANHDLAVEYQDTYPGRIVTTLLVVTELGNYLSKGPVRRLFVPFVRQLRTERLVLILPWDAALFERSLDFYGRRPDKNWSLTDCHSFLTMKARKLTDALTADHHFEQAGFTILLKVP